MMRSGMDDATPPARTGKRLGLRFAAIAVVAGAIALVWQRGAILPGARAALFAVAMLLAVGGWAFHASGDRRLAFRRDLLLGVAVGILASLLLALVLPS
jgi:hypothetical protein